MVRPSNDAVWQAERVAAMEECLRRRSALKPLEEALHIGVDARAQHLPCILPASHHTPCCCCSKALLSASNYVHVIPQSVSIAFSSGNALRSAHHQYVCLIVIKFLNAVCLPAARQCETAVRGACLCVQATYLCINVHLISVHSSMIWQRAQMWVHAGHCRRGRQWQRVAQPAVGAGELHPQPLAEAAAAGIGGRRGARSVLRQGQPPALLRGGRCACRSYAAPS